LLVGVFALVEAPGGGVARVAFAPFGLGFLAKRGAAFGRVRAGSLAITDAGVGLEPPAADRAGAFPGFGSRFFGGGSGFALWHRHRDDSSSSS